MKTVPENNFWKQENTILVLSENYSYYPNLVFSVFTLFSITKKKWEPSMFSLSISVFLVLLVFQNKKQHSKTIVFQEHHLYVEVTSAICDERVVWREDGVPIIQSKENPNQYS